MIANLINTAIGLYISYSAIFDLRSEGTMAWVMAGLGVVIVVLALVSRQTDSHAWYSTTDIVFGALLAIAMLLNFVVPLGDMILFWVQLWVGLTVASIAFWAALYRREHLETAIRTGRTLDDARSPTTAHHAPPPVPAQAVVPPHATRQPG
jgi:hypothetical protein